MAEKTKKIHVYLSPEEHGWLRRRALDLGKSATLLLAELLRAERARVEEAENVRGA